MSYSRSTIREAGAVLLTLCLVVSVGAGPVGFAAARGPAPDATGGPAANQPALGQAAPAAVAAPGDVVYRVNVGGGTVSDAGGDWSGNWEQYQSGGTATTSTTDSISVGPSVPNGTPASLFTTDSYGAQEWTFSEGIQSGQAYEVRLYFAETYFQAAGERAFDVTSEGQGVVSNYDIYADVGHDTGVMQSFTVTPSDGSIDVSMTADVDNPTVSAIEIVESGNQSDTLGGPLGVDFGGVVAGNSTTKSVTVTNLGGSGDPNVTVTGASVSGTDAGAFSTGFSGGVTLAPGESTDVPVTFSPSSVNEKSATLSVSHSGSNSPLTVNLTGEGESSTPVGFSKSTLQGFSATNPTALEFGPDGRLYVSVQSGTVYALDVARTGNDSYQVTNQVAIDAIKQIPNHNDTGVYKPGENDRQITGLTVGGTATQPVVYVSSSDPSIDVGQDDDDTDTNSGAISRLTLSPGNDGTLQTGEVDHDVLVIGLPRSEENHATNGLELSNGGDTLYVAQGGNTNKGAPANNFGNTPEYALSSAILSVDLAQINSEFSAKNLANYDPQGSVEPYPNLDFYYGIPTIQNDDGTDGDDLPFGGNDGINQAKIVEGGPVQVYAPGYRNPYDVVVTQSGQLYTTDHGPNAGWGGPPVDANGNITADASAVTNKPNENASYQTDDPLMKVDEGAYGGHAVPIRANPTGADIYNASGEVVFDITSSNSPVPSSAVNPEEADYIPPIPAPEGVPNPGAPAGSAEAMMEDQNGDPVLFGPTGAIDEYTASNFDGAMQGDLLQTELYGSVKRVELSDDGSTVTSVSTIFNTNGPLGITAQGDNQIFPGTVWTADRGNDSVTAFEPNDYSGNSGQTCSGVSDPSLDEDGDGYDNADEINAGTDPCSSASTPPDFDGDGTSNLNDADDDDDGQPDTSDPFAVDPDDGLSTTLPVNHDLSELSLFDQGWSGLMTNGSDYQTLYNTSQMTVGGAAEVLTVEKVPIGDAVEDTQRYGFQFGVDPPNEPFTVHATVNGLPETPENYQSLGVYVGNGDQNNYVKLTAAANGGAGGLEFAKETSGSFETIAAPTQTNVTGPSTNTDLYLTVDPTTDPAPSNGVDEVAITAEYATDGVNRTTVATGAMPASWLDTSDGSGLAVGAISTAYGADSSFTATWTDISVTTASPSTGSVTADAGADQTVDENTTVTLDASGSTDSTGDALSYNWTQTAGTPTGLLGSGSAQGAQVSFTAPDVDNETTFAFEVEATNANGSTDTDTVNVTVQSDGSSAGGGSGDQNNTDDSPAGGDGSGNGTVVAAINAGGSSYTAADGTTYQADTINTGSPYSTSQSIANTQNDPLYQTERYGQSFGYDIPVSESGTYEVTLKFAELYFGVEEGGAGDRVFSASVEGQQVLSDYDIYAEAGALTATDHTYTVNVTDGTVNVDFTASSDNAKISAITVAEPGSSNGSGGSNTAPTVEPIADQTVTEGNSTTVPVNATDADGDSVSLSVDGPDFVGLSNGALTIAPGSGDAGTYTVDVTATDSNGSTATESFQLTVEAASSGGGDSGGSNGTVVAAINAGGSSYTAADGTTYQADTINTGSPYSTSQSIANTQNDPLYQTERYGQSFGYDIPVSESGTYEVTLKFAELYFGVEEGGAGDRVFSASVEGQQVLSDYDIYAEAGALTATDHTYTVNVTDGTVNVDFTASSDNAKISAIEVRQAGSNGSDGSGGSNDSDNGSTGAASIAVNPGAGIDASTYTAGSFQVENTGGTAIESVTFDVSDSLVPDAVFDPDGTAGDETAKQLSVDSQSGDGVGVVSTADADVFSEPHNGQDNAEGYDVMTVGFDDFEPGESVGLSIDLDPTTIKGVSGSGGAGSVSGLEIAASSVTVEYANGSTVTTDLASDGSAGGAVAVADADVPAAPTLGVEGVSLSPTEFPGHEAATVGSTQQSLAVSGPAGATVQVTHVVGTGGPTDGYDLDPYEIDSANSVDTQSVALGADGQATVPVTLSTSGFDYFATAVETDAGETGRTSNVAILDYQEGTNDSSGSSGSTVTADAGSQQTATAGETVELDANGSTGSGVSYSWTQLGGPDVSLSGADTATPTFVAPDVASNTTLTFEVSVSDGNASDTDTVAVTVTPDSSGSNETHTLTITGTGESADYEFSVSDEVVSGSGLSGPDTYSGSTASGAVSVGTDEYTFTGDLESLSVSGDANVSLDGEAVDPADYGSGAQTHEIEVVGTGDRSDYEITVSDEVVSGSGLSGPDTYSGSTASGAVWGGTDTYTFTGDLTDLSVTGDATVYVDGTAVDPADYGRIAPVRIDV